MSKHEWTLADEEYLKENYLKLSYAQMGENLGIDKRFRNQVARKCQELGLVRKRGNQLNHNFFKVWSPDMAYVLGLTYADGNVSTKNGRYDYCLRLKESDFRLVQEVADLLSVKKPLAYDKRIKAVRLSLSSAELIADLLQLGVLPDKSNKEEFPQVPKNMVPYFIRGFFDGDGYVSFCKRDRSPFIRAGICSNNYKFLVWVQQCLLSAGLESTLRKTSSVFELLMTCQRALRFLDWVYSFSGIRLERKYSVYAEYKLFVEERK